MKLLKFYMRIACLQFILISIFFNLAVSQNKIALVIGNSSYENSPLRNPVNDASDIANVLTTLGFQVTLKTNLNHQQMESVIRSFGTQINSGDVALFYFSGHGTQVEGLNYLVPVGEKIYAADEIKYKTVEAGFVLDKMESAGSDMNIVILDACRNNPFKGFRSSDRGFAYMSAPTGSIISYATAPGSVALDGTGRNSPYTKYLIQAIQIESLQIEDVFKKVREYVAQETGNIQIPWESSSLIGDFYFQKGEGLIVENVSLSTNENNTIPIVSNYLNVHGIELIFVKGGKFMMGSNDGEDDEKPVHQVTVGDFYIGKYEVTQKQWKDIMGANPSYFKGCDNCPVEETSWFDVQEFIKKLNNRTGKVFRLPTEAEWEYAARGGESNFVQTIYAGSDNIDDVTKLPSFRFRPYSVGQKKANSLGIYDMSGNVIEWCSDWYELNYYYKSSNNNPSGPILGSLRVTRGGSSFWGDDPCRVANRSRYGPSSTYSSLGFRLVLISE